MEIHTFVSFLKAEYNKHVWFLLQNTHKHVTITQFQRRFEGAGCFVVLGEEMGGWVSSRLITQMGNVFPVASATTSPVRLELTPSIEACLYFQRCFCA